MATPIQQSALSSGVARDVRPLLDLIDELRSMGIEQDLPLPQIAVMGDQSSGKSSVLEALSGVPFPRGTGLVTRCPCQLTMKRTDTPWRGRIGVQGSDDISSVNSPGELTAAIERVTAALTAGSSGFSSDCIVVEVRAPNVPDLTLIDLPGIVRTVTAGQDARVIGDVNTMIERFLKQERTIVLAIVPANQDVATVDILERALRVDPTGERTIGVLTKPDLVGEGAEDEVVSVLRNERKPLKLGYVMVKNKSAAELKSGRPSDERRYFREHNVWKTLPSELLGIQNLTTKLTKLLTKRIEKVLPELKWELQEQFAETEAAAERLGAPPPETPRERAKLVLRLFADYCSILRHACRGDYREQVLSQNVELRLRSGADRIFHTLEDAIGQQKPEFEAADFTLKLHQELKALRGRELPGLLNSYFFYGFMARHVEMWRPLIEGAKTALYDSSFAATAALATELLPAYPGMAQAVRDQVAEYLDSSADAIAEKIEEVFKHESDPFISKNELSDAILKVRFERFERALDTVMTACGTGPAQAAKTVVAERNQKETQASTAQAKLAESHAATPSEEDKVPDEKERKKKDDLKEHPLKELVLTSLGRWYMANHGVTSMSMVEDMRTVLIAYWGVAAKRITENTCMLFETHLLAVMAEDVEKQLLSLAQTPDGDADTSTIDTLLAQDDDIRKQRENLKKKKDRVAAALNSVGRFAPNLVARPREPKKEEPPKVPTVPTPGVAPTLVVEPEGQLIESFAFTSNGDNAGFIYWLGTSGRRERFQNPHDKGRLRITSSGLEIGTESLLVARKRMPCWTNDMEGSWICVDFGRNRTFKPTHYTLCNGANEPGFDVLSWAFEGYHAPSELWTDLHSPDSPQRDLPSPWGVATFGVSTQASFRYLRIRHTGLNSRATHQLPICAWEFYGHLYAIPTT
ncbi:hypothetical protein CTAYLR_007776 [Chrysophaeum taylorii]|uniref:Uncharacterized protein n=1 Tax=Chrysophaeum taylorii TaxID=2483200 RepID=A0AAD7ULS7_9STRA|nr:hypothetical protein CTAYLR_007776 [Chrysophaeum taylorii]